MVLNSIEKLLEKYDNGETTLKEEQQLKDYFSQETVPAHLEVYKSMFQYFLHTQEEQFTKDFPLKPKKTINLYKWISVAAVAVLMLGVYTQIGNTQSNDPLAHLTEEEKITYFQTKEMFAMLSNNLDKRTSTITMMSDNFDKGTDKVAYLGEFSKTTDKILK
jgi:hypothetical protein